MLDIQYIRTLFDRIGVPTRLDADGDIIVTLDADDDFESDVVVCVSVENANRLSFIGWASTYEPKGDLLFLANRHNSRRNYPTAVVRDGSVRMEYSFVISEEVSDEYIADICIRQTVSSMWTSFIELETEDVE